MLPDTDGGNVCLAFHCVIEMRGWYSKNMPSADSTIYPSRAHRFRTEVLSLNRMPMLPLLNMYPIPYFRVKSYSSTIQFYSSPRLVTLTAVRVTCTWFAGTTTPHAPT